MIKKIYLFFRIAVIFSLLLFMAMQFRELFFSFFIEQSIKKELKESFKEGRESKIVLNNFTFYDEIKIKRLELLYESTKSGEIMQNIRSLKADGVYIDLDAFLKASQNGNRSLGFDLFVSQANIKNAKINYKGELYTLDLNASGVSLREALDIKNMKLFLDSPYAKISLDGRVKSNTLKAKTVTLFSEKMYNDYLPFIQNEQKELEIDLELSSKEANMQTTLQNLRITDMDDLKLTNINLNLIYDFNEEKFSIVTDYLAVYENYEANIKQSAQIDNSSNYISTLSGVVTKDEIKLPFKEFIVEAKSYQDNNFINFSAKDIKIDILTKDFKNYILKADTLYAKADAKMQTSNNGATLEANIYANQNTKSPISLKLKKRGSDIDAKATLQTSDTLSIRGNLEAKEFFIDSKISSIKNTVSLFYLEPFGKDISFDAKADAKTKILYKDGLEIETKIDVAWYDVKLNEQRYKSSKNALFSLSYKDKNILLEEYKFEFLNQDIYSKKPSKLTIDSDMNIELKEIWVYDNLLLKGLIETSKKKASIELSSDKFHYETKDANLTMKVNLKAYMDENANQNIQGEINILDGVLMYQPKTKFLSGDKDIIVIQDMKLKNDAKDTLSLNIQINAQKYIKYKTKEADLFFMPKLTLFKDANSDLQIYGIVSIEKGVLTLSDKEFEFDKSEIYFNDKDYTNPHLNLNLHHYALDNVDIEIYVTNTLNSPLFLFSSNPAMSQNDIMSYILFGGGSSEVFNTSSGTTSKTTQLSTTLLGAGVKELFNKSSAFKIDTLNILTNESGTLGYELGTRFNKNIRLVYKNSDISSVVLQYGINRSLRIDVDIKETGQGVGIYYIKDFNIKTP